MAHQLLLNGRAPNRQPIVRPEAVRTAHTEPDSRTRRCETHSRTIRISSGKIVYEPATELDRAYRRWLREALITGAVFVDSSAAYDTVNHRRLISVLAPMLFNIYTNDKPIHPDTRSFIYADDLCIASQGNDFNNIEASLTSALSTMTTNYDKNQLRANPSKTHVCAFHLRNREAKRELHVVWNGTRLSNTTTPVYLGVHLDRTLCYKTHIEKTKMKVNARNNIIRKLANSKWGCKASTLRPSCLALCYSAAEYACPVWARSTHTHKLNPALHDCCRIISRGLKATNLDSVHLLAGIAPPHIRRTVACRMERTRQTTHARHQLFHHQPAASRLKSRKSFMRTVTPLDSSASSSRLGLWTDSLTDVPASVKMGLEVAESLPVGSGEDWLCWRALNRLRTGVGRAKTVMRRWGYLDDAQSVDCDCGEPQTMTHLLAGVMVV